MALVSCQASRRSVRGHGSRPSPPLAWCRRSSINIFFKPRSNKPLSWYLLARHLCSPKTLIIFLLMSSADWSRGLLNCYHLPSLSPSVLESNWGGQNKNAAGILFVEIRRNEWLWLMYSCWCVMTVAQNNEKLQDSQCIFELTPSQADQIRNAR